MHKRDRGVGRMIDEYYQDDEQIEEVHTDYHYDDLEDTEQQRNDNYKELILPDIKFNQFLVMHFLWLRKYNGGDKLSNPTYKQLHEFMKAFYIIRNPITVSSRLSELRKIGYVSSTKIEGSRYTDNCLTYRGMEYYMREKQINEEFKRKMKEIVKL